MISEFIELIARSAFEDYDPIAGLSESVISEREAVLGFRLPDALRDLHAMIGQHRRLLDADEHVYALSELELRDGYLVFCHENQGGARWAIEAEYLGQSNPRVRGIAAGGNRWQTESSRLSAFVINLVCWQAIMSMPESASVRLPEESLDDLTQSLSFIGDKELRSGAFRVSFVGRSERMLGTYLYNTGQLYIGGRTADSLKKFEDASKLDLDWL